MKKSSLQRAIERQYGGKDLRLIIAETLEECRTLTATAEKLGVSRSALEGWIDDFKGKRTLSFPELSLPQAELAEAA